MTLEHQFQAEIEAFLIRSGVLPTVLGRLALGDPGFVFRLRKGRVPSLRTVDRVRQFMAQHEAANPDAGARQDRVA